MGVKWNSSAGLMGVIRGLLVLVGALHCLAKAVLRTSTFSKGETCIVVPDESGGIWSSEEKPQTDLIFFHQRWEDDLDARRESDIDQ